MTACVYVSVCVLKVSPVTPPLVETRLTHFVAQTHSNVRNASLLLRRLRHALRQPLCSLPSLRHELCRCSQPKHLNTHTHMAASIKHISAMQLLQMFFFFLDVFVHTHMHSCLQRAMFFQWFPRLYLTGMLAAPWGASRLWVFPPSHSQFIKVQHFGKCTDLPLCRVR